MVTTHNQQINSTKDDLLGNTLLFSDLISKTIWVISYLVVTGLYKSGQGLPWRDMIEYPTGATMTQKSNPQKYIHACQVWARACPPRPETGTGSGGAM